MFLSNIIILIFATNPYKENIEFMIGDGNSSKFKLIEVHFIGMHYLEFSNYIDIFLGRCIPILYYYIPHITI